MTGPDGTPLRFDALRAQRLAAPATVYVEQFSAHPLESDAAELYGPLWAVASLLPELRNRDLWVLVDNTAAESILRRGSSAHEDLNMIVGSFWLLACRQNLRVDVLRVPTKENPADPPSRGRAPPRASAATQRPLGRTRHPPVLGLTKP